MTFYATEIDACPAFGWQGGPNIDVLIRTLQNRHERRNKRGDLAMHTYTLPFQNIVDDAYLEHIKSAFMAMGGPHNSFLVKDWADFLHGFGPDYDHMPFGIGDGMTSVFQLSKTYTFGSAFYERPITKPVAGHIIYIDGTPDMVTADLLTGEVDFGSSPPGMGEVLTWSGEFRVPVRFADMYLPATIDDRAGNRYATNGSVTLQEVFGE